MTIITKPISDKKVDKLVIPLVDNEYTEETCGAVWANGDRGKVDLEAAADGEPQYVVMRARARRVSTATTVCLFLTALLVMSIGIIGGVYFYRQFARSQMNRFRGWCNIPYDGAKANMFMEDRSLLRQQDALLASSIDNMLKTMSDSEGDIMNDASADRPGFFKEGFELDLENELYEKIDVPDFRGGRRGRFIHDFNSNKTGIVDMDGKRCFVMPLNRKRVLPPRSMFDLISKMWDGYYEVDTEVVRETMRVVTPPITDLKSVGDFIAHECEGLPTYMLEKYVSGVFKRSLEEGARFAEFAGHSVLELHIVDLPEAELPLALPETGVRA